VTTYAGSVSGVSGCVDGASSQVLLNAPIGISVNTVGVLFITDACSRIVMIATTGKFWRVFLLRSLLSLPL
jgi:hypothetical protein